MHFMTVNQNSPVPLYTQIAEQIQALIESGDLKPGDPLPSIRLIASQLEIAANTVARAYRDLEAAGIVEGHGRKGSFIRSDYDPYSYENPFVNLVKKNHKNGLSRNEIQLMFNSALELIYKKEKI